MTYLIYLLGFIFILGSAVVLHEFGHFIVAKLFKIRVETFSVGFGPRLFGKKWKGTDYRVSAIPLGGYVRVVGLGPDEGFDALQGRYGNMLTMGIIDPLRVCRSALQNGASVAGLLLTTNTLIAEEQTPWGGSRALMTEFGQLDEGLHQPSPDASTPQSLGLGPSVG